MGKGRAKGKKQDRWLVSHKGGRQDGWYTYVGADKKLYGHRALVRFDQAGGGAVLAQFNHVTNEDKTMTLLMPPGWHAFDDTDFIRTELYDELCAAAGAHVHAASKSNRNRAARAIGASKSKDTRKVRR